MGAIRRGLTLEYIVEKRKKLTEELESSEHYAKTQTIAYGKHDPFSVPLPVCDTCGSRGQMQKIKGEKIKWRVSCLGCDKTINAPQKRPWQAALMWCDINLGSQSYRSLPLFGLSELPPVNAKERMLGIRRNLELRKKIAGLDRQIASKTDKSAPGRGYQQRLEAYLKWCLLSIRLINNEKKANNSITRNVS